MDATADAANLTINIQIDINGFLILAHDSFLNILASEIIFSNLITCQKKKKLKISSNLHILKC